MADGSSSGRRATAARSKSHAARLTRFFRSPLRDRFQRRGCRRSCSRGSPAAARARHGSIRTTRRRPPRCAASAGAAGRRRPVCRANRCGRLRNSSTSPRAPLAQLDRASGYEPGGRRFESCRARDQPSVGRHALLSVGKRRDSLRSSRAVPSPAGRATLSYRGLRPAEPPTRSLAGAPRSPLRSRGSLAALVRAEKELPIPSGLRPLTARSSFRILAAGLTTEPEPNIDRRRRRSATDVAKHVDAT